MVQEEGQGEPLLPSGHSQQPLLLFRGFVEENIIQGSAKVLGSIWLEVEQSRKKEFKSLAPGASLG